MTQVIQDTDKSSVIDVSGFAEPVEIFGNGGSDSIVGSAFADTIHGGLGGDRISGGGGDDMFTVAGINQGADVFNGGDGFDRVVASVGDDVIALQKFAGTDTVELIDGSGGFNTIAGTSGANILDFSLTTLLNIGRIEAGSGDDNVIGSSGDDWIDGGTGGDRLSGGGGDDTFSISGTNQGADIYSGGDGVDRVLGSSGDDVISLKNFMATDRVELIEGAGGLNVITGTSSANTLDFSSTTLSNVSRIAAGASDDNVIGSTGDDMIAGEAGNDRIDGRVGFDTVMFAGLLADYTINVSDLQLVVTDRNRLDGDDGTDTLQNIERLVFADGEVLLTGSNSAPLAVNDTGQTVEDTAITFLPSDLLANDSDPDGDTLTIAGVGNSIGGKASLDGSGNVTFVPALNFNGNASFDYTISDGKGGSASGTVSVAVASVNDAPIAMKDAVSTNADTSVVVPAGTLLANDSDADNDPLNLISVANAVNGTVILNSNNDAVFTPDPGFVGTASFEYTVGDGTAETATGHVAVTVGIPSTAPQFQVLVNNVSGLNVLHWDGLSGEYLGAFVPRTKLPAGPPSALTIGPDGDLYVAYSSSSTQPGVIYRYDAATGQSLGKFADLSQESDASSDFVTTMTFGPDGDLYVFDQGGLPKVHKIFRFEGPDSATPGALVEEYSTTVDWQIPNKRIHCFDMVFGPEGDLYVGSGGLHEILIIDGPSGDDPGSVEAIFASAFHYNSPFDVRTAMPVHNGWSFEGGVQPIPRGLAWGSDGNLYVSTGMLEEAYEGRICVFDPNGTYLEDFVPLSFGLDDNLRDIEFGPDGNLYLTNRDLGEILVFGDPTGPQDGQLIATLAAPPGVAFTGATSINFIILEPSLLV